MPPIASSAVRPKNVLLVEDDPSDVRLFHEALDDCPIQPVLRLATDGETALNLLFQEHYRPDLIILDLNLPKISGSEVLRRVKESPLQHTPIVVFSSDPHRDAPPYADAYIAKPVFLKEYLEAVRQICDEWLLTAA